MLDGKRLLITGVLTRGSIAFEVARQAQELGAEIVLTGFGRGRRLTSAPPSRCRTPPMCWSWMSTSPADCRGRGGDRSPLGFARRALARDRVRAATRLRAFLETPSASAVTAFETSAFSLKALAARWPRARGSSERVGRRPRLRRERCVPVYDWMGVAKRRSRASRATSRETGPEASA